jgi:hypothetical protein
MTTSVRQQETSWTPARCSIRGTTTSGPALVRLDQEVRKDQLVDRSPGPRGSGEPASSKRAVLLVVANQ